MSRRRPWWVVFGKRVTTKTLIAEERDGRRDIRILETDENDCLTHDYGTLMFCDIETLKKFREFIDNVIEEWEEEKKDAGRENQSR